jgi:cytochrome P450
MPDRQVCSSMASEPSQRLSISETLCQISTFIAAGHETTSNALSWTLYALARNQEVQLRLRTELQSICVSTLSCFTPAEDRAQEGLGSSQAELTPELLDDIIRAPYLDAVVREALRVHAPVTGTMRVAAHADVIPVQTPFRDATGAWNDTIEVNKGDIINVPLQAINTSIALWGEDAEEFR